MNTAIITGYLTRDIELRYTNSGMAIAKTSLASTRKFTSNGEQKEEVLFIDIDFFGRSAEVANQYLIKGSKILVSGRIVFTSWIGGDGKKQSKHYLVVENLEMLDTGAKPPIYKQPSKQPPKQKSLIIEEENIPF